MDLIYMNTAKEDQGVMKDFTLDLAFGIDENDFECKVVRENHCCESGYYLYCEGTEYGGIVDDVGVDTEAGDITYSGRTWHGILDSKVLEPNAGEDYLIVTGEANAAMAALVERMHLSEIFKASSDNSGVNISNYKMNRYITGYSGIKKMLKQAGAKLKLSFRNGFVELSAEPLVDYSKDEQFDTDQIAFKIKKKGNAINHVICLGKGDLAEREVIHVYADSIGNISEMQSLTGIHEVTAIYENTNAADSEELRNGGVQLIKESWNSSEIDFDFESDSESYDIGDIVGAKEIETGIEVAAEISKKIVTINKAGLYVDYSCKIEKTTSSVSGGGGSVGEHDHDDRYYTEAEVDGKLNAINSDLSEVNSKITNLDASANSFSTLQEISDYLEANPLKTLWCDIGHLDTSKIKAVLEIPYEISSSNYVGARISRVGNRTYLALAFDYLAEYFFDCYIYKNNNGCYKTTWVKR